MKLMRKTENSYPVFPTFFDDFFRNDSSDWFVTKYADRGHTLPAVNIYENEEQFRVELAAPGLSKNDFKIELDKNVLTISSAKKENQKENAETFYRHEFSYGDFQRCFRFPENVLNSEKINASYKDGILRIELAKREEMKPKPVRQIEVQ